MSKGFSVRVELHGATMTDYQNLHTYMEQIGFSRTIRAGAAVCHLPTAEYIISGNHTLQQVGEAAARAAAKTGKTNGIFATESAGWWASGLTPVRKAA